MKNSQKGFVHIFVLIILALAIVGLVVAFGKQNFDIRERAASGEPPRIRKTPRPRNTPTPTPYPKATSCSDVEVVGAAQGGTVNGKKTYYVKSGATIYLHALTTPQNSSVNWKVAQYSSKLPDPGTFSTNLAPYVEYKAPVNKSGSDQGVEIRGDISEYPNQWLYCPPFTVAIHSR
jgi:hypothetical protein